MQNGQESVTGGLWWEPGSQELPTYPAPSTPCLAPATLQQAVPEKQLWQLAGSQFMPGACVPAGSATVRTEMWGDSERCLWPSRRGCPGGAWHSGAEATMQE